jgi:hypothetical protein
VTDFERLLRALSAARVEYIIVGGFAATLHGSARLTEDLDIVYSRSPQNIERLARALAPLQPYLRGAPPGLPFRWDAETLRRGLNFTLTTELGDVDILGEIAGGGTYESLLPDSQPVQIFGVECLCLGLQRLIEVKRAAGRPKDFDALAELERIAEEQASLDET